mmetsp:Transcript_20928/g.36283  ORF Transcript_20928/g.36283 Transcript_20928/m.36283 type:complete len:361 (-) Transcript_20928:259-1341(-)
MAPSSTLVKQTFLQYDVAAEEERTPQKVRMQTGAALPGDSSDDDNSGPTREPSSDITTPKGSPGLSFSDAGPAVMVSATPETTPLLYPQVTHAPEQWAESGMMEQSAGADCFMLPAHCYMTATEDWWTPVCVAADSGAFEYDYGPEFPYGYLSQEQEKQMGQIMYGIAEDVEYDSIITPAAYGCNLMPIPEHDPTLTVAGTVTEMETKQVIEPGAGKETRTTVMMRNLPEGFTRTSLLELLSSEGFFGRFDFIYIPFDFKRQLNLGYALINLVSSSEAQRFTKHFNGFRNWMTPSDLPCVVVWSDPHQGLSIHVERYRNSPVMHESVPEPWRPLLFKHGVAVPFPEPTKKIKAPKVKAAS